jgi:hypothetical protein
VTHLPEPPTARTMAGVYLPQTNGLTAFEHAVAAPSTGWLLLSYVAEADARLAARYPSFPLTIGDAGICKGQGGRTDEARDA